VNFLTDIDDSGTNAPVTLATLTVPYATVADTYFTLELTPNIKFKIYSILQYVVPAGETVVCGLALAKKALDFIPTYISGWVVLS